MRLAQTQREAGESRWPVGGDHCMITERLRSWRALTRAELHRQLAPLRAQVSVHYVWEACACAQPRGVHASLGCNSSGQHPLICSLLKREARQHGDLLALLRARECTRSGQPVAEKAYEWYACVAAAAMADWICKMDDDTLPHLARLERNIFQGGARLISPFSR